MKSVILSVSLLLSTAVNAQTQGHGYVSYEYPQIEDAYISSRSSYDGICKALLGPQSSFVDGSREINRPALALFDHSYREIIVVRGGKFDSVLVGPSGNVQKVYADRKAVISQISCWGELPKPQTTPTPTSPVPTPTPIQPDPVKFEACLNVARKLESDYQRANILSDRCVQFSGNYIECLRTVFDNLADYKKAFLVNQCAEKFQ